jgi:hypothetical protein
MCDNTCAIDIATDSIKQKRSKAIDMRFHRVRDRVRNGEFFVSYINTNINLADFFNKNLEPTMHIFSGSSSSRNTIEAEGVSE